MKQILMAVSLTIISLFTAAAQHKAESNANANVKQEMPRSSDNLHQSVNAGPANVTLEFENGVVRVQRIRLGPHEKVPMHHVTPRVVVMVTDADLRYTFPDGHTKEEHYKAGQTEWLPAQNHEGENLSDHLIEFLAIVPNESGRPSKEQ